MSNHHLYNNLFDLLKRITGATVLSPIEIQQWFGMQTIPTHITYLVILNETYIFFQDNSSKSIVTDYDFKCFTEIVHTLSTYIYSILPNLPIYGIVLSKQPLNFLQNDLSNENIKYITFDNYKQHEVLKSIHYFLHTNHIFLTDDDGDCIMI